MREFCTSGSVGTSGRKRPGVTRQAGLGLVDRAISFADLDGDGKQDVVAVAGSAITVRDTAGQLLAGFPVDLGFDIFTPPTLADIDGDGDLEIIVGVIAHTRDSAPIYAYHHDGTPVAGFPAGMVPIEHVSKKDPIVFAEPSAIVATDLDGDNKVELIYSAAVADNQARRRWLGVLDGQGQFKAGFPADLGWYSEYRAGQLAAVDMNSDGKREILVTHKLTSDESGALSVYDAQGKKLKSTEFNGAWIVNNLVVGDVDGDGKPNILLSIVENYSEFRSYLLDENLNPMPGWPVEMPHGRAAMGSPPVALADMDGDGDLEAIVTAVDQLYIYQHDGTVVDGFPITMDGWLYANAGFVVAHLASAKGPALIFGTDNNQSGLLHAIDISGKPVAGWPKKLRVPISGTAAVGDLEADGQLDIAVMTSDSTVYIFNDNPDASVKNPAPWPTYGGSNGRENVVTNPNAPKPNWKRTVILIYGKTQVGQDLFLRGGIDHDYSRNVLGRECTAENGLCAVPIRHLSMVDDASRRHDGLLDWYGGEHGQGNGISGSPAVWTTNSWPAEWGEKRTVDKDGYGETPLNRWGHHYWMLDVEMNCDRTVDGWFELKSFITNGPGWERSISQSNTPYASQNHMARCGHVNVFRRNQNAPVEIRPL
jgi:hypothetical protein